MNTQNKTSLDPKEVDKFLSSAISLLKASKDVKKAVVSSTILAANRDDPSLDDMPSDEEVAKSMGSNEPENIELEAGTDDIDKETTDLEHEDTDPNPVVEETKVGPYDLTFHIRKIISAFTQVVHEAEALKKLTENITSNMSSEQQAQWIEQRRFFIETAKEAESKWSDFKRVLLKFSITPKL